MSNSSPSPIGRTDLSPLEITARLDYIEAGFAEVQKRYPGVFEAIKALSPMEALKGLAPEDEETLRAYKAELIWLHIGQREMRTDDVRKTLEPRIGEIEAKIAEFITRFYPPKPSTVYKEPGWIFGTGHFDK